MQQSIKKDILIFLFLWIFYYLISSINPVMPDWDWMNYHHYNAWAVLNDRLGVDFFATNSRTCINPICNLINYVLMFKLNNHPDLFFAISSLDTAFLLFFAYKIADFVFSGLKNLWMKNTALIFSFLFVCLSPLMINETDFSRNDAFVGAFLLCGFYIFIKNYFRNSDKKRFFMLFLCGILFGVALGLKLSVYPFVVALGVLFLLFFKKIKNCIKDLFLWTGGVLTAFLAVDGWWIVKCYASFKNPFFPYFNNIFKSPYVDVLNCLPNEYFSTTPKNFAEWIFCPFLRGDSFVYFLENGGFEPRFGITYVAVIVLFIMLLVTFVNKNYEKYFGFTDSENLISLLIFVNVTYVLDLATFGTNGRFITGIFPLFGILVVTLIFAIAKNSKKFIILNLSIILVYATIMSSLGGLSFWRESTPIEIKSISKLIEEPDLKFKDNSVVLLLTQGTSFIVSHQNQKVQYVGFQIQSDVFDKYKDEIFPLDLFLYSKYFPSKYAEKYVRDLISSDKNIYVIFNAEDFLTVAQSALDGYNKNRSVLRKYSNCRPISGKVFGTEYFAYEKKYVCDFN